MSKRRFFHSSFTPSQADPEILEAMLVGRSKIAQRLVERIHNSATTADKHQDLLIGPRGIGKTHLLSLVRHRIKADDTLQAKLAIAWLPEDPYTTGYTDLLLEILRALAYEYPSQDFDRSIATARDQYDPVLLQTGLEQALLQWLGARTLLILIENLQDLFSDIEESGQEKLRALIQNSGGITIVATSTSLFASVAKRNKMFYGFFRVTELPPLNVFDARELLVKLSQIEGDKDLEEQLRSPLGLARIRAMHLLAGGSPRVCTLFYEFLTRDSIDTLFAPFNQLVDKLMPYYQGQMRELSAQQRRIVEAFCRADGALTAVMLAEELHVKSQTVSTQIRRLRELGYLTPVDDATRSTLFELREPLMRYILLSKQDRGEYLKHIIEFLRLWYSPMELEQRAAHVHDEQERHYLLEAALWSNRDGDPIDKALRRDFTEATASGDHEAALQSLDGRLARNPKDLDALETKARILAYTLKRPTEALPCLIRVTEIDPARSVAWVERAAVHFEINEIGAAIEAMRVAVAAKPDSPENLRLLAWYLRFDGKEDEARGVAAQVLEVIDAPRTTQDWDQKGTDLYSAGRYYDALEAYMSAIELQPDNSSLWNHFLGLVQLAFWRLDLCLKLSKTAIGIMPENNNLLLLHAINTSLNLSYEAGLTEFDSIVTSDKSFEIKSYKFRLNKASCLMYQGRSQDALEYLQATDQPESRYDRIRQQSTVASLYAALSRWDVFQTEIKKMLTDRPVQPNELRGSPLDAIQVTPRNCWRESARQWIKAYALCNQLPLLAARMANHAWILSSGQVELAAAESWFEVFRSEAQAHRELQPVVRALSFILEYRKNPDPIRIQALPQEERILVEPGLAESQATRPTALDKQIEAFIERLEVRVKHLNEERERKAYWTNSSPSLANVIANLKFETVEDTRTAYAKPLLYSNWIDVPQDVLLEKLRVFAKHDETIRKVLARPGLAIVRALQRPMTGSELDLYQIDIREDERYGAIDILHAGETTVLLDGSSPPLHQLVSDQMIKTSSADERVEYVELFCSAIRAEKGRFAILFPEDLPMLDGYSWDGNQKTVALELIRELDGSASEYRALICYSNTLFKTTLRLSAPGNSLVEMLEDESIQELSNVEEVFDGPIRWVWRKPKQ